MSRIASISEDARHAVRVTPDRHHALLLLATQSARVAPEDRFVEQPAQPLDHYASQLVPTPDDALRARHLQAHSIEDRHCNFLEPVIGNTT